MDKSNTKKVAIYARVSTNKSKNDKKRQEVENQLLELREFCERKGWAVYKEYIDHESGKKSNRQGLDDLYQDGSKKKFDLVLFWALDRFSREGVLETLQRLQLLSSYGVEFHSYTEEFINSTGIFKEVFISFLATLSKQEVVRKGERVKAGLERAKKAGKVLGRKPVSPEVVVEVHRLRNEGLSIRAIAGKVNLSSAKVGQIVKPNTARR